jgi:hypothetical protein
MKRNKLLAIGLTAIGVCATSANATTISDTTTAGWSVDRYAPGIFGTGTVNGDNAIIVGTTAAEDLNNRPVAYQSPFYNTQGVSHSVTTGGSGAWSATANLYVTAGMLAGNAGPSSSEFWLGTGVNNGYYIMALLSGMDTRSATAMPFTGSKLAIWNDVSGTWTYLDTSWFKVGWNNFNITSDGVNNVNYSVNGIGESSQTGMGGPSGDPSIGDPSTVYLQNYNAFGSASFPDINGGAYVSDWKGISVEAYSGSNDRSVPDGGNTLLLLGSSLCGVGFFAMKKHTANRRLAFAKKTT